MKHTKTLLISLLLLPTCFSALAAPQGTTGCEAKRQDIEQQIDYARLHDNNHRANGLEKARSELNANCTDEGLRAKRESDVRKKERKVEELRKELAKAQADGRTDKVDKKGRKLSEAQAKLEDAKSELNK